MKIAILGAGFAGIATAWNLLQHKIKNISSTITVFDAIGIGGGASGVSAGLLHPFSGAHSKLNRWGREGLEESIKLLEVSKEALGHSPYTKNGILRLALTPLQKEDYSLASKNYPGDILWMTPEKIAGLGLGLPSVSGIFIKEGITVYSLEYLKGLWNACEQRGALFQKKSFSALEEFEDFDVVIIALGGTCKEIQELSKTPLKHTKGHLLELKWPQNLPPLPFALNSNIYCVMSPDNKSCLVGSTYEKNFISPEVDLEKALDEIIPKLALLYPPLKNAEVIQCKAGIRVATPQHLPIIEKLSNRHYVFTGLGSKGLLYHALYAKKLVELIFMS